MLQTKFRIHRRNQIQRINNFKALLDKFALNIIRNENKTLFKIYEETPMEIKLTCIKEFYFKKNEEYSENMKKFLQEKKKLIKKKI